MRDGRTEVVIVGGGVAAIEALIGLRELAGDRVHITLVAPEPDFVLRPMLVVEPFGAGEPRRFPLGRIASDFDAALVRARVAAVDTDQHAVFVQSGAKQAYDVLVLAPGARALPVFEDAITFGQPGAGPAMAALLEDIERGSTRRVGFVASTRAGWVLPLYELALMTANFMRPRGLAGDVFLVTPEARPLEVFGDAPSATVARMLDTAGIEFVGSAYTDWRDGRLIDQSRRQIALDRVVTLPMIRGPEIRGIPAEHDFGFIPVDRHGRVTGLEDVYAAGDATDFPIKQGGLATQQADAVVEHIAARCGAPVDPKPFRPVLRGLMFTGDDPRFLRDVSGATPDAGAISPHPLWLPATKIAGRYLGPYLSGQVEPQPTARSRNGFVDIEIAPAHGAHRGPPAVRHGGAPRRDRGRPPAPRRHR